MEDEARPRGGRPDKRAEVTAAARRVFGSTGYAQAGMDVISAQAGVSTRTIYKHFPTKEDLFAVALEDSAAEVAEDFVRRVRSGPADAAAEATLRSLGRAYLAHIADHPDHFAMVQQVRASAVQLPESVINRWHRAGPDRVLAEVVSVMQRLIDRGLLRPRSPRLAALHFVALLLAPDVVRPWGGAAPETTPGDAAEEAVSTFVSGWGAHDPRAVGIALAQHV